jgi:hypothetical protein
MSIQRSPEAKEATNGAGGTGILSDEWISLDGQVTGTQKLRMSCAEILGIP